MKKAGLILSIALITLSCDTRKLFEEYTEIPGDVWNSKNVLHFNVNISDTIRSYNIYIGVRNADRYPYSNLYLFVTAHSPDGNSLKDTVEVVLADELGKWLGKGAASIYTTQHPYKSNIRFPVRGIYTFDIEQAMRVQDLRHISNIGLRIEAADKN
ncbi:MAG: gliding motility lipoprotein GldH [Bacteroidales bacterium]|nr:gliding motility lipoprotein GldH [Bacteroidales bacterium]